jgi:hypothetical protein
MHDPTGGRRTKSRNGVHKTTPKTSLEGKIQPNAFNCHSINALLHAVYLLVRESVSLRSHMRQMAITLRIVDEGAAGVRCYRLGMDIFLDATSSLKLLRASRRDDAIVLKPSDVRRATPPGLPHTTLDKLQAPALLDWLKVPESHNLDIIVPAAKDRVRCRQIDCRVYGHPCAEQPFLELSSPEPDGGNPRIPLLPDTHVYVLCAEEIALAMAQRLHRLER